MSLINKMLQDLDARGTAGGDAFPSSVKPVAPGRRAASLRLAGACAGGALALAALAWFGWDRSHAAHPARPAPQPSAPAPAQPVAIQPAQGMGGTIAPAPAAAGGPVARVAPAGAVEAQPADPMRVPLREPMHEPAHADAGQDAAPAPARHAPAHPRARVADDPTFGASSDTAPAAPARSAALQPRSFAPMEPDSVEAREARKAAALELATRETRMARLARLSTAAGTAAATGTASAAVGTGGKSRVSAEGREEAPAQRAENEYRRALADLQEGRMNDTIAALQQALRIDPGHDAARQTLVGLLVESGRGDDAIRELQAGLARDARQPALAMLLARLQIERGGSGIETLQRTLPYAGNSTPESAEYHAFLAGALQRQQRHHEAVGEYQQALRAVPANGVWWMGLGISLQADKRNAEALDAFQKARASGSLDAELQAFVERRIQQLGR